MVFLCPSSFYLHPGFFFFCLWVFRWDRRPYISTHFFCTLVKGQKEKKEWVRGLTYYQTKKAPLSNMEKDKNFKEKNMKNILTVLFCILFTLPFYVFLMFKVTLGIPSVHVEGTFSGKNVLKISGSSGKKIFWMYTVNKNLCLFKIFHAIYLFAKLSCELYVQNWKPVQSLQNIITFSLSSCLLPLSTAPILAKFRLSCCYY